MMDVRSRAAIKIALILAIASLGISSTTLSNVGAFATGDPAADFQRSGATIYAQNCSRCHGPDGKANTPKGRSVGAADLTSNDWMPDTARDIRIVTRGKEDMPSFKAKLKPAEIEAVISYIRRFKN
jgi:mono/diheme cytochrome c family protein